jgi:hypothetical protein
LFNGFGTLKAVSSGQTRARAGLSATGVLGARAAARGAANAAVAAQIGAMVGGVVYTLQCVVQTSDGQKLSCVTHIACQAPQ